MFNAEMPEELTGADMGLKQPNPRCKVVSLRVTDEERRVLEEVTRTHNISMSTILREGLLRAMELDIDDLKNLERQYQEQLAHPSSSQSGLLLSVGG